MKHENIDVLFEHNAVGLFGENGVEGVHLVKRMGESDEERYDLAIDGFFLAIGHQPNSDIFKPTALCSNSTSIFSCFITRSCMILEARRKGFRTIR